MSRRDVLGDLRDCVDNAERVLSIAAGMTYEDFVGDYVRRGAIERYLINASEAVWQITKADPNVASRISDTEKISTFRHILVHRYFAVEPRTVWEVATIRVRTLSEQAGQLLSELESAAESDENSAPF